jgi:hypothetical protein
MCYWYSGTFAGQAQAGDLITYRIKASDQAQSPNNAYRPLVGKAYCPVTGPGSVAVVDLTDRFTSGPFITGTLSDLGIPYTVYTTWPADFNQHEVWFFCLGVYHDHHILSQGEADDLVAALQAGNNIYLESSDAFCYDDTKTTIKPWFGVQEIDDGGDIYGTVNGVSGSLTEGISMNYWGESAWMDEIGAVSPAKLLLKTGSKGRGVEHDAGTYRTVVSVLPPGELTDEAHPNTRKELFVRILEYLGVEIPLYCSAEARLGDTVRIRLEGDPGDQLILMASLAEHYWPTGYGTFRLDPTYLFVLYQGTVPPSGLVELPLTLPREEEYLGLEVHLQAVVGEMIKPQSAKLTNREILTFVE